MPTQRALTASLAGLALGASLLLAGCGGDDQASQAGSPTRAQIAKGVEIEQLETWPLTGEQVAKGTAALDHPVLVVKMDNTESSAPQVGLAQADLVVEELVEGGSTRLAAFFYENVPAKVGPVRSMRASDIGIVSPVGATMVTSGAASQTIARISGADITYYNETTPGFYRDPARTAPYDLFDDLTATEKQTRTKPARPEDYLEWGRAQDLPKGSAAGSFSAVFSPAHTTTWRYADGGYVNQDTFAASDDQFPADSVLVLRVEVGDAGYLDPAGNTVPETKFSGSGSATLFHGGRMISATWTKKALGDPVTLSIGSGSKKQALQVPAGHTWLELVPRDGGSVAVSR